MPVFTFEKISPPTDGGPIPATAKNQSNKNQSNKNQSSNNQSTSKKSRGLIVQILDRFAEARVSRSLRKERSVLARKTSKA
jgi:hypothetical protein